MTRLVIPVWIHGARVPARAWWSVGVLVRPISELRVPRPEVVW